MFLRTISFFKKMCSDFRSEPQLASCRQDIPHYQLSPGWQFRGLFRRRLISRRNPFVPFRASSPVIMRQNNISRREIIFFGISISSLIFCTLAAMIPIKEKEIDSSLLLILSSLSFWLRICSVFAGARCSPVRPVPALISMTVLPARPSPPLFWLVDLCPASHE